MAPFSTTLQPADEASIRLAGGRRRAHVLHALADRLYRRLCLREVVLTHPVPADVRQLISEWLHRDGHVLAIALYTSGNGRRFRCHAQAFAPELWRRHGQPTWACRPIDHMRLVSTPVLWPAPQGVRQAWPDLPF